MFGSNKEKLSGRVDTLIAEAARISGDVEFTGGLHLDGRVTGNVKSETGNKSTLWISEKGQVEGNIDVPNVILNGSVRGDVVARDKLVLGPKASITGNVTYGSMEMAQGAQVSGKLMPIGQPAVAGNPQANAVSLKSVPVAGNFDGRRAAT